MIRVQAAFERMKKSSLHTEFHSAGCFFKTVRHRKTIWRLP